MASTNPNTATRDKPIKANCTALNFRVRTAKIQGCTIGLDWLVPRGRVRIGACHPLWTPSQSGHANRGYRPILRHPFVVHRPVGESVAPRLGAFGVVVVVQSRDAGVGLMAGLCTHAFVAFCLARAERRLVLGTEHCSSGSRPRARRACSCCVMAA